MHERIITVGNSFFGIPLCYSAISNTIQFWLNMQIIYGDF